MFASIVYYFVRKQQIFYLYNSVTSQAIPYGENPEIPCTVGKLPENMVKNRYKTTFPCM